MAKPAFQGLELDSIGGNLVFFYNMFLLPVLIIKLFYQQSTSSSEKNSPTEKQKSSSFSESNKEESTTVSSTEGIKNTINTEKVSQEQTIPGDKIKQQNQSLEKSISPRKTKSPTKSIPEKQKENYPNENLQQNFQNVQDKKLESNSADVLRYEFSIFSIINSYNDEDIT